jgi:uncharacterized membrane protein
VVETVEFYPPEGFNSAEVGFLYKGSAEGKDIVSLLIYLANKGYIKIAETEKKSLFSKTQGFKVTKIKDYDGENVNEELFLKGLFNKKSALSFGQIKNAIKNRNFLDEMNKNETLDEVTDTDLHNSFYTTNQKITANLNSKEKKKKIIEKGLSGRVALGVLMALITFLIITIRPVLDTGDPDMLAFAVIFPGMGFAFMIGLLFSKVPKGIKFFAIIWGMGFGGVPWCFMVLPALLIDPVYLWTYIVGMACIVLLSILIRQMPKRTPYGIEILGKIKGFKNFLKTVEKDRLEALVMSEPEYFYNILPYTYVLGVSDLWIKKFETIALRKPDWYDGTTTFSAAAFSSFMTSTMASASSVMTSSPSSGSRGSGGGSSGGGSGGGGGGSW